MFAFVGWNLVISVSDLRASSMYMLSIRTPKEFGEVDGTIPSYPGCFLAFSNISNRVPFIHTIVTAWVSSERCLRLENIP